MSDFKDHFSQVASSYQNYRPTYPAGLFETFAQLSPAQTLAWDVGCGNGQASLGLTAHFDHIVATDASSTQIKSAQPHPQITYEAAPAEASPLSGQSVDAVLIAQALHWFEFDKFYAEVRRVARPNALILAVAYEIFESEPEIDAIVAEFYEGPIGPYWTPERRYIEEGYRNIPFPFQDIDFPTFHMSAQWALDDLIGYFSTWSALNLYKAEHDDDPLVEVAAKLRRVWGDPSTRKNIKWPIKTRAGRIWER